MSILPNDFVLRDVRKHASRYLRCQVPNIDTHLEQWAGTQGNVVAFGCGYRVTYYVTCLTNHQCSFTQI